MNALRLSSYKRKSFLSIISVNWPLELAESNSESKARRSKTEMLHTACEGVGGGCPSLTSEEAMASIQ